MANTTNYNWETPDDTDLVKDGAAAIRTLGNSIDTTTKNLNPETTTGDIAYRSATANTNTRLAIGSTGQVLTVAAGVPSWATPTVGDITEVQAGTGISVASGTGPIPVVTNTVATAIDAKGDLIVGTGADTFARLAVGTNGHTLVADSSVSPQGLKWAVDPVADVITTAGDLLYGTAADTVARLGIGTAGQVLQVNSGATAPEWATVAAGGMTLLSTFVPSSSTGNSFTGLSGYKHLLLTWHNLLGDSNSTTFGIRLNNSSSSIYSDRYLMNVQAEGAGVAGTFITPDFSMFIRNCDAPGVVNAPRGFLWIYDYASTAYAKSYSGGSAYNDAAFGHRIISNVVGTFNTTSAITSVDIVRTAGSGTFSTANNGVIKLYGVS